MVGLPWLHLGVLSAFWQLLYWLELYGLTGLGTYDKQLYHRR